ncbi:phosphotyrosyl phosphatase activator (PTPA) family protein [Tasmannia lanceolata]|uniref:phosphotyrosyl phosphatase activator (PTPA) family protein n=1 Tax=Tasmannia lanceolata TaxID=3420 RepID=UPI0040643076
MAPSPDTDLSTPLQPPQNQEPPPPPQSTVDHHHSPQSNAPPCRCGGPTTRPLSYSEISPPPVYRPIRSPALPIPPSHNSQSIILSPVPHPQKVPTIAPPYHFLTPSKKILSPSDAQDFLSSTSGSNFLGFIAALSSSIHGRKLSDPTPPNSPTTTSLLSLLQTLINWIQDFPPTTQSTRYGNPSFRDWHHRLSNSAETLTLEFLPENLYSATVELAPYLSDSFGNPSRIDFGTGHETNFAAFLYCLARLGLITESDYPAIVLRVFVKYLELMRKLQDVYCLEPAGSHGVWGLDDYHFLPFVFGSAQLIDHKYMKPKSIHNQDILDNFSDEYLYLSCVAFVKKVKKGLFSEHSPLLDDISGVPTWNKVNSGLLKMYKAEVLEKVPIMQHFLFGSLIKWE